MIIIGAEQQTETPARNRTARKDEIDSLGGQGTGGWRRVDI